MPILATNIIQEAFSPLISLFEGIMVFIHNNIVGGSWGFAIVGLTVVVRAVMVPLTFTQLRSMQKMQALGPQMKAIKERYKDDRERQNQETMKLFRENNVNPFASCLPFVLQIPVFISLFYMLRTDLKLDICGPALKKHFHVLLYSQIPSKELAETGCNQVDPGSAKFLFIPDITAKATGVALVTLILLYVGSQLGSTLLMSASAEPSQRWIMLALPLFFIFILYRYPAGLLVYWITTNLWTIGQGYFVRRRVGHSTPGSGSDPPDGGGGGSPNGGGPSRGGSPATAEPVLAGAVGGGVAPPPPPRKKKKRSGRRR